MRRGPQTPLQAKLLFILFLLPGSGVLVASNQPALPEFDFTRPNCCARWTAQHDVDVLDTDPAILPYPALAEGQKLRIRGPHPTLMSPELWLPSHQDIWLRIRLRSDIGGIGQVSFFDDSAKRILQYEASAGQWTDLLLPLHTPVFPDGVRQSLANLQFFPPGDHGDCVLALIRFEIFGSVGVTQAGATADWMRVRVKATDAPLDIVELSPREGFDAVPAAHTLASVPAHCDRIMLLPRFEGQRDRLYSGFAARGRIRSDTVGCIHFVEQLQGVSKNETPVPKAASKKGLQVQMSEDALALGIKHAALNVNLSALIDLEQKPDSLVWKMDGAKYFFRRRAVENIKVKILSDAGVQVALILLNYIDQDQKISKIMCPPRCDPKSPNKMSAFNLDTDEGLRYFKACIEFLADRFSSGNDANGRVTGYIVGNEVDAHWEWYNLGRAPLSVLADEYLRAVRVAQMAVRKSSATARVYISLEHCWTTSSDPDALKGCAGRLLLDYLNELSKLGGDFDWHIAYHPYPENLFEPRTWRDKNASPSADAPYITFKNVEQLPAYLRRPEQLYHGEPRRIILSEQGFNTPNTPDGEVLQAAGYCYAYYKIARLDGIDAFILHRHVDHAQEGGLNLGLWTHKPGTLATADRKKQIYAAFLAADTPDWEQAFEFALPVIGVKRWEDILP